MNEATKSSLTRTLTSICRTSRTISVETLAAELKKRGVKPKSINCYPCNANNGNYYPPSHNQRANIIRDQAFRYMKGKTSSEAIRLRRILYELLALKECGVSTI